MKRFKIIIYVTVVFALTTCYSLPPTPAGDAAAMEAVMNAEINANVKEIITREHPFLKGGDLSQLSYIEQMGGKFYLDGVEKDCFEILQAHGFNVARLRLYNDPGNPRYAPSNRLPKGIQGPDDILSLARRAKDHGMQIQLTFHWSDFWTNGATQIKPHEWRRLPYPELKKAVYDFTYDFMMKMKEQGTIPEYVSLGNESADGILFPDGQMTRGNHVQMAELYNQGYDAVKAVSPDSIVMIHLDGAGEPGRYEWFFGEMDKYGVKYDMIGASYYPYWTGKTLGEIAEWAKLIVNKFDKDIFIMEIGLNWNHVTADNIPGQLIDNGPYNGIYSETPEGQYAFMKAAHTILRNAADGRIRGSIYWDPVMIAVPKVGWALHGRNVVSNTTLFDFTGNALKVIQAFEGND